MVEPMTDKSNVPVFEIKKWNAVALWAWDINGKK